MATEMNPTPQPDNQGATPKHLRNLGNIYESADDLNNILREIGDYFYCSQLEGIDIDDHMDDFVDTYGKRLDAYYTRECARKVLEGRIDELERIEQWIAEHFLPEITIAENGDILLRIDNQIAELRAAIKDGAE